MLDAKDIEIITGIVAKETDPIKQDVSELKQRVDKLEQRFDNLEQRFDNLEQRFDSLEQRVGNLEFEVQKINLKLENEVMFKINAIADGYLDLNRKMDTLLNIVEEYATLPLRVTSLEKDVRVLKQKAALA